MSADRDQVLRQGMRYRTIVADPPWHYGSAGRLHGGELAGRELRDAHHLPYGTMTVEEIAALPVADLADESAHLYVWTTQKYLRDTYAIVEAWGFRYSKMLTWCKAPSGFCMGSHYGNASEFILFGIRGSVPAVNRQPRDWWEWPRAAHSAKPEAFLDIVEQVSPGPYVELFARRARFGWSYWGDQSLGTTEMEAEDAA